MSTLKFKQPIDPLPMNRIKVINDVSELVPLLRTVDTETKKEIFKKLSGGWFTIEQIEEEYGEDGKEAIMFFEKMKLVESRWGEEVPPTKSYHTYYTSFQITATCPVLEISDVLAATIVPIKEFKKLEKKMLKLVTKEGIFSGKLAEEMGMNPTYLKSLVRRSAKMEFRGQRIELLKA